MVRREETGCGHTTFRTACSRAVVEGTAWRSANWRRNRWTEHPPSATGEVANASELARSLKLEVGWVCEVLRMTRLAPDIIRAILDGRQPRHLNLHAMRGRQGEVPLDWDEQREMFGFGVAGG